MLVQRMVMRLCVCGGGGVGNIGGVEWVVRGDERWGSGSGSGWGSGDRGVYELGWRWGRGV